MSSLHARIVAEIEAQIRAGAFAPGARLPVEHELAAQYCCARMTVSKAMGELARRGLIDRRKRAGTFVARPRVHATVLDIPDLAHEISARGQAYRYRCLHRATRAAQPEERAVAADGDVLEVEGVHEADGLPIAFEHRIVSLSAVPGIAAATFEREAPGGWLLERVPWTEVETRITAEGAATRIARLLGVAPGTACLVIERSTWRGGAGVTQVRQWFLGSAYDLVARFGAEG